MIHLTTLNFNNILPVRLLIQYRVALYTRQIFKYRKQAFKNNSGIPLPTANFYFYNWSRKLTNKIVARSQYLEYGVINSGVRYYNEISKSNETLSKSSGTVKKRYKAQFFWKKNSRTQTKFNSAN